VAARGQGLVALLLAALLASCGDGSSGSGADSGKGETKPRAVHERAGFTVSPSGSDSNPGTEKRPWRTIQKALDELRPGQTALVRAGRYAPARCERGKGGSAARGYVTIEAGPGARPALAGAADGVLEVACDYLRVQGLLIAGPGVVGGTLVYGLEGSDHVDLVDNEIRGSTCQGIFLEEQTDDWRILRNWIHDNGHGCDQQAHGVYLQGDGHLVANNVIEGHPEGYGIQAYDYNRDARLVNNTIVHSGRGGIVAGGDGCRSEGTCGVAGIEIANNIVAFNSTEGIVANADAPRSCDVHDNLAFRNGSGSFSEGWPQGCLGVNRTADPRFAGATYHLSAGSPAVDAADAAAAVSPDRDGVVRPEGKRPDIGAYELRAG
jgi:hypothetical protein